MYSFRRSFCEFVLLRIISYPIFISKVVCIGQIVVPKGTAHTL